MLLSQFERIYERFTFFLYVDLFYGNVMLVPDLIFVIFVLFFFGIFCSNEVFLCVFVIVV